MNDRLDEVPHNVTAQDEQVEKVQDPRRRELIRKMAKASIAIPTAVVFFQGTQHCLAAS